MTRTELQQLIAEIQQQQSELDDLEVKSALEGTPGRAYESLTAFANQPGGGVMVFGRRIVRGICSPSYGGLASSA